jgi:hypothetical protein
MYEWLFVGGRVAEMTIEHAVPGSQMMHEVMKVINESYGQPTTSETIPCQNMYGVRGNCFHATWRTPEGSLMAMESIRATSRPELVTYRSASYHRRGPANS